MNGISLHDPLAQQNGVITENGGGEITIASEATRLTTLKDGITTRLDTYYTVLRTVRPALPFPPRSEQEIESKK